MKIQCSVAIFIFNIKLLNLANFSDSSANNHWIRGKAENANVASQMLQLPSRWWIDFHEWGKDEHCWRKQRL